MTSPHPRPLHLLSLAAALLAACVQTAPDPAPLAAAPLLHQFEASPTTVLPGEEVSLRWRTENGNDVTLLDTRRGYLPVPGAAGEVKVQVMEDTTFVLTVRNERGVRASRVASVRVQGAQQRDLLLSAFPTVVSPGEPATLVWSAPGARAVTVLEGDRPLDLGGQGESGSLVVEPPDATTRYTLRADSRTETVVVRRTPALLRFGADVPLAEPGSGVTLAWEAVHATKLTLSVDGRGELATITDAATLARGTFSDVLPTAFVEGTLVSYSLTAENEAGTTVRKTRVVVGRQPTVVSATAPRYAKEGTTFTLNWRTAAADLVAIRSNGATVYETRSRAEAANGQLTLRAPQADTTYSVVAINSASGVEGQRELPVEVVGEVAVSVFTAAPPVSAGGCAPVTLRWKALSARRLSIVEDGLLTVRYLEGRQAEQGTVTVYPNRARTTYTLTADNTLDPAVRANAQVTVTTPAGFTQRGGGTVFADQSSVELDWTSCAGGTAVGGTPWAGATLRSGSTGFEDISRTGTELEVSESDNGFANFTPVGTEMLMFGQRRAGVWQAMVNGWVIPGANSTWANSWYSSSFPSWTYNFAVAPFAADLVLGNGKMFWEQRGQQPNAYVIVQWNNVQVRNQPSSSLTFQAKMYQNGGVEFEYANMTVTSNTFSHASGIQAGFDWSRPTPFTDGPFLNSVFASSGWGAGEWREAGNAPAQSVSFPLTAWVRVGTGLAQVRLDQFVPRGAFAIAEIMYAPNPAVVSGEWFEVRNTANVAIDMSGMTIDFSANGSATHTIGNGVVVQPGTALVLGQTTNRADNDNVPVDYAYGSGFTLPDTAGTLRLLRGAAVLNTATYTTTTGGAVGRAVLVNNDQLLRDGSSSRFTITCGAEASYGNQSPRQRGTPGQLASCSGYILQTAIPNRYNDISSTGTLASLSQPTNCSWQSTNQVGFATVDLGNNSFPYFRSTVSAVTLSVSGWMLARSESQRFCGNFQFGYPFFSSWSSFYAPVHGVIAPFWNGYMQYDTTDTGGIRYQRLAANDDPNTPAAHWIFQWNKMQFTSLWWPVTGPRGEANYQVKIFDNGDIEFHYGDMVDPYLEQQPSSTGYPLLHRGQGAAIWIESPQGLFSNFPSNSWAVPFSVNQQSIDGRQTAIRYRRAMP